MSIKLSTTGPKISPCLWFDERIEEAVNFYISVFANSRITAMSRYPEGVKMPPGAPQMPAGTPLVVSFELEGAPFMALNGGPLFKFSEALSFVIHCETQAEIDYFWDALAAGGGEAGPCGWLKDRFGLSWQVTPEVLGRYLQDKDSARAGRVMQAMLAMGRIDIAALDRAYAT